jgi:hypothetical protein
MGLLSKILGAAGVDRKLEQTVKNAVNSAVSSAVKNAADKRPAAGTVSRDTFAGRVQAARSAAEGPSGFSWGPVMPPEENQYNYPGGYAEYFEHVFREDFPAYALTREQFGSRTVFKLRNGPVTALTVELLPESSEAKKLRRECQSQGIPYLRFYYDHEGWWNTRAYVNDRVKKALMG